MPFTLPDTSDEMRLARASGKPVIAFIAAPSQEGQAVANMASETTDDLVTAVYRTVVSARRRMTGSQV